MVGHAGLKEIINNGGIKIQKSDTTSDDNFGMWEIIPKDYSISDLKESHKICPHIGFLVKTLSQKRWVNPKHIFEERDGIINLLSIKNRTYFLKPGESVLLYTNEYIEFGDKYFGLILPKTRLVTDGITITTAYIDPKWKGLIQLIATNNSGVKQRLKSGGEIANLVLIEGNRALGDLNHLTEGRHYGMTWNMVFNQAGISWRDRKRNPIIEFIHFIRTYWLVVSIGLGVFLTWFTDIIYNIAKILF